MREIKFRAWDTYIGEKGIMLDNHTFETIGMCGLYKRNDLIWMQFTGLTDKNGVEIYEGDVVESKILLDFTGDEKIKGRVLFDDLKGMWVVEEINPDYAEREYLSELVAPKWPKRTEVIGNIYEHPHLINKTEPA